PTALGHARLRRPLGGDRRPGETLEFAGGGRTASRRRPRARAAQRGAAGGTRPAAPRAVARVRARGTVPADTESAVPRRAARARRGGAGHPVVVARAVRGAGRDGRASLGRARRGAPTARALRRRLRRVRGPCAALA